MAADAAEPHARLPSLRFAAESDMLIILIEVFLAAPVVNQKYLVLLLAQPHQKVSRLHIVVDQSLRVHPLDSI